MILVNQVVQITKVQSSKVKKLRHQDITMVATQCSIIVTDNGQEFTYDAPPGDTCLQQSRKRSRARNEPATRRLQQGCHAPNSQPNSDSGVHSIAKGISYDLIQDRLDFYATCVYANVKCVNESETFSINIVYCSVNSI